MNTPCMQDATCDGGKHGGGVEVALGESSGERKSAHKLQLYYLVFSWVLYNIQGVFTDV